jgi:hypothetical protein
VELTVHWKNCGKRHAVAAHHAYSLACLCFGLPLLLFQTHPQPTHSLLTVPSTIALPLPRLCCQFLLLLQVK